MLSINAFRGLIIQALFSFVIVGSTISSDIYHSEYEGISVFLSVDAKRVQTKLDEYTESHPGAPPLFVPSYQVFPGLEEGKHVVSIEFGVSKLFEFIDTDPYEGSVLIYVPFLSALSPDGPAKYAMMVDKYLPDSLKGITELLELSARPEISLIDTATGSEELTVTFKVPVPCSDSSAAHRVFHELDDEVLKSLIFGEDEMLSPYGCQGDQGPGTEAFARHCAYYEKILPEVLEAAPNVCISTIIEREESCLTSFDVTGITQRIRDMLFLDDGPITILGAEKFKGVYSTGLKHPCIE